MSRKKSESVAAKPTRREFIQVAGSSLASFSVPMVGYGLPAPEPRNGNAPGNKDGGVLDLHETSFFYGRQYFVLKSGRAKMILQADRADLGPALSYLLFDAEAPEQSRRKSCAFNFVPGEGVSASALRVELGGFLFFALGQRTETRWISVEGIPVVEAIWWAGGIRVTEQFSALSEAGVFQRSIKLEGANLMGEQPVTLRLSLPKGRFLSQGPVLVRDEEKFQLGLIVHGNLPVESNVVLGYVDIGPVTMTPQSALVIHTGLLVKTPPSNVNSFAKYSASLASTSSGSQRDTTKKLWATMSHLTTQDSTIQELFDHARYSLAGMIADDGSMDAGIFEYGRQWVRDTSNSALGAIHAGYFELARAALQKVLTEMITDQGSTMNGSRFSPVDLEELDQMGEVLHALKAYRDWTGDDLLLREHRARLVALVKRPLNSIFRDETGMVHDRREYWERTFDDAYELAYQTYLIQGLKDAADLATAFDAADYADQWRKEADRTLQAMLHHSTRALVDGGHLIKRRNVSGEVADAIPTSGQCLPGAPLCTERYHRLEPDASTALPIALGIVDPQSPIARNTLDHLEQLWNTRWNDGGYDRYNTSSQLDQPGPWPFANCFILRAQHEARLYERSRRTLTWLNCVQGARSGCWFEEIPSTRSQEAQTGLIPWTCAEIILFVIRHWLGVQFREGRTVVHPNLYPGSGPVSADLRFRKGRLHLEVRGSGPIRYALVNGSKIEPARDGSLILPADFSSGTVVVETMKK